MSTRLDTVCPPAAGLCPLPAVLSQQRSHSRVAALLAAAAPLAAAAVLAATSLAAAVPVGTPSAAPRVAAVALPGDLCATTLSAGAYDTLKWPLCAGD